MNCPKCNHPSAECIIGNYWKCPGCDDREKFLGLVNKLASNPIPLIHRSFESDDPIDMGEELAEAVLEFSMRNGRSPDFITISTGTYKKISNATGRRLTYIRGAKVKPILFVANGVYVVS